MTDHKRVHGNYTEYDGDDGYTTLTLNRCEDCGMQPQHCDCDSNEPTHDHSRTRIT